MDPLAVHALLPPLVDTMCTVEPEFCDDYRKNAAVFADRLNVLHDSLTIILQPLAGRAFLLSHPFASYLLRRYGIGVAGIIEEMPGSEPTARDMQRMVNEARQSGADAILVLPQSPDRAARAVSETLNIPLIELDPIGGRVGRSTYEELMLYNAHTLMQDIVRTTDAGSSYREGKR
jgi:zinc transport system substrate-binding protein